MHCFSKLEHIPKYKTKNQKQSKQISFSVSKNFKPHTCLTNTNYHSL